MFDVVLCLVEAGMQPRQREKGFLRCRCSRSQLKLRSLLPPSPALSPSSPGERPRSSSFCSGANPLGPRAVRPSVRPLVGSRSSDPSRSFALQLCVFLLFARCRSAAAVKRTALPFWLLFISPPRRRDRAGMVDTICPKVPAAD